MRVRHLLIVAIALIIAGVAARAQAPAPAQVAEIEKAVADQVRQYYRAVNTLDLSDMQFWSRGKLIGHASGGKVEASLDAITANWRTMASNRISNNFDCQSVPVRVLSADTAMAMCIGPLRIEYKNGNISNFNYLGTMLWAKEAAGWKVIFLQETSATR